MGHSSSKMLNAAEQRAWSRAWAGAVAGGVAVQDAPRYADAMIVDLRKRTEAAELTELRGDRYVAYVAQQAAEQLVAARADLAEAVRLVRHWYASAGAPGNALTEDFLARHPTPESL